MIVTDYNTHTHGGYFSRMTNGTGLRSAERILFKQNGMVVCIFNWLILSMLAIDADTQLGIVNSVMRPASISC